MSGLYHIFHGLLDRHEQKLAARNTDASASTPAPVQVEDVRMENQSDTSGGCGVSELKYSNDGRMVTVNGIENGLRYCVWRFDGPVNAMLVQPHGGPSELVPLDSAERQDFHRAYLHARGYALARSKK